MKNLLNIIIVLLLLVNNAKAQSHEKFLRGTIPNKNFLDSFGVSLVNYTVIVSVVIDGKKYKFLLDTGASNCLSKKTASKLNLPPTIDSISIADINNSLHQLALHQLPKFQLGKTVFKGFYFLVSDNFFYDLLGIDGIIGSHSFRDLILHFDAQNSQIKITDNLALLNLSPQTKKTKLKLSPYQLHPYVNIKLNACKPIKQHILFDTGSNNLYSISNQSFEEIKKITAAKVISKTNHLNTHGIYGRSKEAKSQYILEIPVLKINGYCIENIMAQSFSSPLSSIGTKIFCYGKVTLDYQKKHFHFCPYSPSPKQACTNNNTARYLLGINFSWLNGAVKIISIWDNLKAQKAGLKIGMKVKKIGTLEIPQPTSPSIMKEILSYNFDQPKLPITVELENGETQLFIIQ